MIHQYFTQFFEYLHRAPVNSVGIIAILIFTGLLVGFVNTIAGMATALSYALFMAMGLPINVANGTTRFGVMSQFLVSSAIFKKKGYLNLKIGTKIGIPVGLGALLGAEFASVLRPDIIETIMGIILPIMAIMLFFDPKKIMQKFSAKRNGSVVETNVGEGDGKISVFKVIAFFIIGIYGGFTHAGVGLLIMFGSFFMMGMDLIHSNAIKQFAVVIYTPLALLIFILHGQVNWPIALIYSIGNIAGGILGSYASIKGGDKFIRVSVAIVIFAVSGWMLFK